MQWDCVFRTGTKPRNAGFVRQGRYSKQSRCPKSVHRNEVADGNTGLVCMTACTSFGNGCTCFLLTQNRETVRGLERFIIIINPLTTRVVGAPQMILQPVFSIFPSSPLPSGTCRTPGQTSSLVTWSLYEMWIMDPHSSAPKKYTSHGKKMRRRWNAYKEQQK